MDNLLFTIGIILFVVLASFLFTAALYAVVAWAFGITFSWAHALGIWIILGVVSSVFRK